MSSAYDVAILGGGPAGASIAIGLLRAGRKVVLLERSDYQGMRVGETFGPEIRPLLQQIGAWEKFSAMPHVPFRTTISAWGGSDPVERSSLLHPLGDGWHVDRVDVDRMLTRVASEAGADVQLGTGFCSIARTGQMWEITPAHGVAAKSRYIVDASGRGAPATASAIPERRWQKFDRLVAVSARIPAATGESAHGELLLESAENGWWYTVPQPDGALVATYFTDADLLPAGGRAAIEKEWINALRRTLHTAARFAKMGPAAAAFGGRMRMVRADSGMLTPDCGDRWLAIGDAAMACDPLSGSGFARAIRSGWEAAAMVDRALDGVTISTGIADRVNAYLERKHYYYGLEKRWPGNSFWSRRALGEIASADIEAASVARDLSGSGASIRMEGI